MFGLYSQNAYLRNIKLIKSIQIGKIMAEKVKSLRQQLMEMEVGDVLTCPLDNLTSVRAACSNYGLQWDKKFLTESHRENRTVTVTRTR